MRAMPLQLQLIVGLAAAAGLAAWVLTRRGVAQDAGAAAGRAAVDLVSGGVLGVGDALGIPRTEARRCQAAIEARDWFEASKACPAGEFIGAGWGALWGDNTGSVSGSW